MIKKIAITGANGFIGANLCNYLFEKGYDFSCLVRHDADISLLDVKVQEKIIYCDYHNQVKLAGVLSEFHTVIHLAALTRAKYFDDFYESNVCLTEKIVHIVNESPKIKHLIFVSSQAALGPSMGTSKLNERYLGKPISWYGISKNLAEQKVKSCQKKWTILRPASVYG